MRKINWGVIGTAGIAKAQTIPGMVEAENCRLYAIAGRTMEKAIAYQQQFGFEKAYDSYDALLQDPEVEAVYIPLPNTLHYEWAKKAMEHGKHVLCEKPLVPTAEEAKELFRVAEKNNVILMEAFAYLHSPWVAALKDEIDRGTVGTVRYIESQFLTSDYNLSNIRMRKETNGGCTFDLGCYTATMITWMLGRQPDDVRAVGSFSPEGVDVLTSAVFSYNDGAKAAMICGMVLETDADKRIDQLRIEGTDGAIWSTSPFNGCGTMSYTILKNGKAEEKTLTAPQNYRLEVEQMGRCIADGEKPHVSEEFTTAYLGTMEKILAQIGY